MKHLLLSLTCLAAVAAARADTLAERLLATYSNVTAVACEVRRDSGNGSGSVRMLSRVYFQRPDHLHVETVSPIGRL